MSFLSEWFTKKNNEPKKLVLNIVLGEKVLAKLFHDGTSFCLQYCPDFKDSGIAPFNPNDFKDTTPVIGEVYKSKELWNAFTSRLPSPSRDDFKPLLESLGIAQNEESLLRVLAKVGKISISKPWQVEVSNDAIPTKKLA